MRTRVRVRSARGGAGPGAAPAASGSPPPWVRRDRSVWGGFPVVFAGLGPRGPDPSVADPLRGGGGWDSGV